MILVEKDGVSYIISDNRLNEFENKGFKKIVNEEAQEVKNEEKEAQPKAVTATKSKKKLG